MTGNKPTIDGIVYKTTNIISGKWYIGKDEKNDKNYLGSGKLLSREIAKYGKDNFKKEVLAHAATVDELLELEKTFIEKLSAITDKTSYNSADSIYAKKEINAELEEIFVSVPEDKNTRRALKISKKLKNKPKSQEHKNKISQSKKGIKQSPNTVDKKRIIGKQLYIEGKICPPINDWTGKKHTNESREKISKAKTGIKNLKKRLFTVDDQLLMKQLKDNGATTKEIASIFSTSGPTILRYIKELET